MPRDAAGDLAFLADLARDPARPLAPSDRAALALASRALIEADAAIIRLGGKAGRLGECIAATGLLEAVLAALQHTGHATIPIHLVVDGGAADLFDAASYHARGWPGFRVSPVPPDAALDLRALANRLLETALSPRHLLALDMHGGHDGLPRIERISVPDAKGDRSITILADLARTGLRAYAVRGPDRRYADFVEDLFSLPRDAVASDAAQPRILLSDADDARYPSLAGTLGLDPRALLIVCFFQSVVVAKCYERWDEVLALLCERAAAALPGQRLDILVACGPDDQQPPGFAQADLADWLGGFTGTRGNARVRLAAIPVLRDLAIVLRHAALTLANDTGPGHLSGALGIPTITPYLPGDLYSRQVWASTPHHHGLTLDPNPYTHPQIEAAVIFDRTDIINRIPPDDLADLAFAHILAAARYQ
jgi:ADP-heptose:LPS heptosyltransferase